MTLVAILKSHVINSSFLKSSKLTGLAVTHVAKLMNPGFPDEFGDVEYPENRKLRFFDRVPQLPANQRPPKMFKRLFDMRGPELIHNKFQYGQFGIQAIRGGALRYGHIEMIRLTINRKMNEKRMFAVWRIDQPWKPVTRKGKGHRMGGGKGSINHYVYPVKANRLLVEVGGECHYEEVFKFLRQAARLLPFRARAVSREELEAEQEEEERVVEGNINPFTFEYCVKNNMMGVRTKLSVYDDKWYGKHR